MYSIFVNPVIAITNAITSQTLCNGDTSSEVLWESTNTALAVGYNWELDLSTVPTGTTALETNGTGNLPEMTVGIMDNVTKSAVLIMHICQLLFKLCQKMNMSSG